MAIINSKFDLEEKVWFMKENKALNSTIRAVKLWTTSSTEEDSFNLDGYGWYKESYLYPSKEELFKGIIDES